MHVLSSVSFVLSEADKENFTIAFEDVGRPRNKALVCSRKISHCGDSRENQANTP